MKEILEQQVEQALKSKTSLRLQRLFQSRAGLSVVAAISFFEAALPVPLITDPFMVAAIMADRRKAVQIVFVTTVSSVVGGVAAFAMAAYFFDFISGLMTPALHDQFVSMLSIGESGTLMATLTGAVTPIPYTLAAWVVAVAGGSMGMFIIGSIIGRGFRYILVGYCTYVFGPTALRYARRYIGLTSLFIFIAVAIYIWLKM